MMGPDLPDGYRLVLQTPAITDYRRLREVSGLTPKTLEGATAGLPNTWCAAVIEQDGRAVAMGRVVGDGGLFFQIVDMAVEPAHQGRGLGKAVMAELKARAPSHAYVSLIADGQAHRLYEQFGFGPTAPKSIGMAMMLP
jgi:GNAT superfamily N-acetyltransferase